MDAQLDEIVEVVVGVEDERVPVERAQIDEHVFGEEAAQSGTGGRRQGRRVRLHKRSGRAEGQRVSVNVYGPKRPSNSTGFGNA